MVTFIFDGTFEGLLTSIFDFYDLKPAGGAILVWDKYYQPAMLEEKHIIVPNEAKAKRV